MSLLVVDRHGRPMPRAQAYTKAAPPVLGDAYGANWAAAGKPTYQLPGGGVLIFDLDRLTLQDFRAMMSHYQINVSLSVLSFMIHQAPYTVEGEDKKIVAFIRENIDEMWARIVRAMFSAYWAGYAPNVLQFENDASDRKIRLTKLLDIEPERALPNWKEVESTAPVPAGAVKPKIRLYDGMKIQGQVYPVPPENTLWYPLLMQNGDYFGRKLLKPAFPAWFFSQIIHLYANRYFERFGEPVPIGRAPFEKDIDLGDGTTINGKQAMEAIITNLRNRASVVMPNDRFVNATGQGGKSDYEWTIEYLESQMRGADFERYLSRLDEEMSLGIFTPVLLYRTADVGSYNLGEAHMQIFLVMIGALMDDLAEYLNRYIVRRLIDINFGPNAGRDVRFIAKKMGETAQATYRQILQALVQAGRVMPNLEDLGLQLGMRLEEINIIKEAGDLAKAKADAVPAPVVQNPSSGGSGSSSGAPDPAPASSAA